MPFIARSFNQAFVTQGVTTFPVTVMKDGFGKNRHAQVGACSFNEMRDALLSAQRAGHRDFVVVSHNFEMLKPRSQEPDSIVVSRFERLCAYLSQHRDRFDVSTLTKCPILISTPPNSALAQVGTGATLLRYGEQAMRRVFS